MLIQRLDLLLTDPEKLAGWGLLRDPTAQRCNFSLSTHCNFIPNMASYITKKVSDTWMYEIMYLCCN